MLKNLFKPVNVGAATILVVVASLLSNIIGLIRDKVIALHFGTSIATDTYNASFLIPDALFNFLIAGALMAALLPVFSEYLHKDKEEAFKIANTILTGGSLVIGVLAIIAFVFMGKIIPILFPDATPAMQIDIIKMTRLMLPSALIFTISNALGNILMSYKHFLSYAISPILYNIGIIFGVVFLSHSFGIYAAAIGVLIGGILHCLIRIIDTGATEYRFHFQINFSHPGIKKIISLMIPRTISLIFWEINLYLFALVGISIVTGGLAAFNFAKNIQSFAVTLFGIPFATAVFPYLTGALHQGDQKLFTQYTQKTIQRILFFTIPSMAGIMILSTAIVGLILGGGAFDANSITLTSLLLFNFAISVPFESLVQILTRSFYARQNTFTPMITTLVMMVITAFCTVWLAPKYGIKWFSIGFTIANAVQVFLLAIFLRRHLHGFNFKNFFVSVAKTVLATGIMAIVILLSSPLETVMAIKLAYVIRILLGILSFFAVAYLIKAEELASIKNIIIGQFQRKTGALINTDYKHPEA